MIDYKKVLGYSTSDYLRTAYNIASNTRSDFVDSGSSRDWLALVDCMLACEWDITPDDWTQAQVDAARDHGIVPEWGKHERDPLPAKKCAGFYVDAITGRVLPCQRCNWAGKGYVDEGALHEFLGEQAFANIGAKGGWCIFNIGEGCPEIQKDDFPDGGPVKALASDEEAYPLAAAALSKLTGAVVSLRRWA